MTAGFDVITIAELTLDHSQTLARILSTDELLHARNSLQPIREVLPADYYATCQGWAKRRRAVCYAVLLQGEAIGSISLCDIDLVRKSARTGYWLASEHWGKGYATQMFSLLIEAASEQGIETLGCSIQVGNEPSLALWRRWGATFTEAEGRVTPELKIGPRGALRGTGGVLDDAQEVKQ